MALVFPGLSVFPRPKKEELLRSDLKQHARIITVINYFLDVVLNRKPTSSRAIARVLHIQERFLVHGNFQHLPT